MAWTSIQLSMLRVTDPFILQWITQMTTSFWSSLKPAHALNLQGMNTPAALSHCRITRN